MPISQSDQVFSLVKSLSKAEKRNFRLYSTRIMERKDLLFLKLFDLMDKQKTLNDAKLIEEMGGIEKGQYSNLKRHLYRQIIISLRMLHKEKRANFKVREYLDFAYILYGKGLYLQALKLIKKAKELAKKNHLIYMQLILMEFEKKIESRHITRSGSSKAEEMILESQLIQTDANHLVSLSNLKIKIHGKYLQNGHVRSKQEAAEIRAFYHTQIDHIDLDALGLIERIYYVQSRVWYNYILLDFKSCIKYAIEWVDLLNSNHIMIDRDVDLYMRGHHYVLSSAIHIKDKKIHADYLAKLEAFRKQAYKKLNTNSQILSFLYVHTGRLDSIILSGQFDKADKVIQRSLNRIRRYKLKLDQHRVMVFYFKFAWIYFGYGNISKALSYLDKIINNELHNLREDLQDYARIMKLLCHYELGNIDLLQYLINTYSNYFNRKKSLNDFLEQAMNFFTTLRSEGLLEHKKIIKEYYLIFSEMNKTPYERRAFIYLDILSWLESKIKNQSLKEIVGSQFIS